MIVKFIKRMNEMDQAVWRGFLLGVLITVLTLCPFVLLAISFVVHGIHTHHIVN